MMDEISERLARWGRVTFIGYNSIYCDEPILQRAFWQAFFPPYLTVNGGNTRLDRLVIMRATALFRPEFFDIPHWEDGAPSFRLDAPAPDNGFNARRLVPASLRAFIDHVRQLQQAGSAAIVRFWAQIERLEVAQSWSWRS